MSIEFLDEAVRGLDYRFYGGVSDQVIADAAASLDVAFSPSYEAFLRRFGSGYVSDQELIGLGGPPHLDVVELTSHLRRTSRISAFPRRLVPVAADGFGNYDCLDTSQPGPELPVVFWLHDGGDDQVPTPVAPSYAEWLEHLVKRIRAIDLSDAEPGSA